MQSRDYICFIALSTALILAACGAEEGKPANGDMDDASETSEFAEPTLTAELCNSELEAFAASVMDPSLSVAEKKAKVIEAESKLKMRDWTSYSPPYCPDITEENGWQVWEWQLLYADAGGLSFDRYLSERLDSMKDMDARYNSCALEKMFELGFGYTIFWSEGSALGIEFQLPSYITRLGFQNDRLLDKFYESPIGKLFSYYIAGKNSSFEFKFETDNSSTEYGYTVFLFGKHQGIKVLNSTVTVNFRYDSLYSVYWINSIEVRNLDFIFAQYGKPAEYSEEGHGKAVAACVAKAAENGYTKKDEQYIMDKTETEYVCIDGVCAASYSIELLCNGGGYPWGGGVQCFIDANDFSVVYWDFQRATP